MASYQHSLCGCFYLTPTAYQYTQREYLPQLGLSSHTTILSTTSRTILTQIFLNPSKSEKLDQVRYTFPLYDGVTVVGFKCTVSERLIVGVVKEKQQARTDYKEALDRGQTAALLEQFPDAADCFTTTVGNVPPNEKVIVEITYLGELKNDAETNGIRFTIPTAIAPRYGTTDGDLGGVPENTTSATSKDGIQILVDIAVEDGATIRGVQSPSHPIAMTVGRTSSMPEEAFDNQHASATLTLGKTELDKDFIIVVTSKGHDIPRAIMETHPTIPNHRALMATLVPKFSLPAIHPEVVFVVDRSGSMEGKISTLVSALKIFLKSLPVGIKFNICSFGSRHAFLWNKSRTYDESSLSAALKHVESFDANLGGTVMLAPIRETVQNRYKDMPLEVIITTDGQIWDQNELFDFINEAANKSVRFFSLGIGDGASSSLVEGIARAGDGFAQFVGENEKMEKRIVRMLKGALTPHVKDYTMEVKYEQVEEDYEMVESVRKSLKFLSTDPEELKSKPKKVISLFDDSAKMEENVDKTAGKCDQLPIIGTPNVLQAPHRIPPLYSCNRTSVYLLITADVCQQKPKAIILRATSEHGPLELEIPVQDVGIGETIHQLAARKAIQDLGEGRGWITEAKDNEGQLIKTKYEGRWVELVEREGVRLGVEFQVGSKWCSFVAVEKSPNKPEEELLDYEAIRKENTEQLGDMPVDVQDCCLAHLQAGQSLMRPLSCSMLLGGSSPPVTTKEMKKGHGVARARKTLASGALAAAPPTVYGTADFDAGTLFARHTQSFGETSPRASPSMSAKYVNRGTAVSPNGQDGDESRDQDLVDYSDEDLKMADATNASEDTRKLTAAAEPSPLPSTDEERMYEVISLQAYDGSWKLAERLFDVLGVEEQDLKAAGVDLEEAVMATLLAVAFLEGQMSREEGVWEMVVEKAMDWLEARVGVEIYEANLVKLKHDILGVA